MKTTSKYRPPSLPFYTLGFVILNRFVWEKGKESGEGSAS
jgi:hypothetical protein